MSRVTPRRTTLVFLLVLLSPSVLRAAPQTRMVFGPPRFERATAAPDDHERWFVSTGLTPSPLMLDVWNGDVAADSTRVTAAWIAIDGREVVGPSLVKKAVHAFRVAVDLAPGRHELSVRLAGAPGTYLRVALSGTIQLPDLIRPRAGHTATVLSDGRIVFAGGRNQDGPVATLELFDPRRLASEVMAGGLVLPRADHSATLTPDGRLFMAFGSDASRLAPGAEVCEVPGMSAHTPTGAARRGRSTRPPCCRTVGC